MDKYKDYWAFLYGEDGIEGKEDPAMADNDPIEDIDFGQLAGKSDEDFMDYWNDLDRRYTEMMQTSTPAVRKEPYVLKVTCDSVPDPNLKCRYMNDSWIRTPFEIYDHLNKYIIGQDRAKRIVSVAAYEHLKRCRYGNKEKSNILLVGPTGCGKTLIARTLAEFLKVPYAIADASSLTEAGYRGGDIESILTPLLEAVNGDIGKAEEGIVFIDEIDKIANDPTCGRDISGAGVQRGLLKILEGCDVSVPVALEDDNRDRITINTSRILFICAGAFPDLEKMVEGRTDTNQPGFFRKQESAGERKERLYKDATTEDFEEFGMLPEFLGRLPMICFLDKLDADDFKRILTEPEDSIAGHYRTTMSEENTKLMIDDDAIEEIALKAFRMGIGARALKSVMETILTPVLFLLPSYPGRKEVRITRENVKTETPPDILLYDYNPKIAS